MKKVKRWQTSDYEIQSVTQVTGMYAVYVLEDLSEKGKFYLERYPINFLGVVSVETTTYEKFEWEENSRIVNTENLGNLVVGLELGCGHFQICDEVKNFCGLSTEEQPITEFEWMIDHHKKERNLL